MYSYMYLKQQINFFSVHDTCSHCVFFSAGALLSYEVALRLKSQYNLEPVKMFVSGVSAPHVSCINKTQSKFEPEPVREIINNLDSDTNRAVQSQ